MLLFCPLPRHTAAFLSEGQGILRCDKGRNRAWHRLVLESLLVRQHNVQVELRGLLLIAFLFGLLSGCDQFFSFREEGLRVVIPVVGRLLSFLSRGVSEIASLVAAYNAILP